MQAMTGDNSIIQAADKLIAAHDGDVALLYLYIMRRGGCDMEQAAMELCRTMQEISAAYEKLERMGLSVPALCPAPEKAAAPLPPAEELPQYRTDDIIRRSKTDGSFSAVVAEAQQVMGHTLSSSDLTKLFGIYDYLALPAEVIMVMLHHCAEENRARYGESRRLSMRTIEKQAYIWANNEILSLEQAEEYIQSRKALSQRISLAKEALQIRGRELSATELKYVRSWLDMGFGAEALAIAYDRTVTHTGSLKWSYMNKILLSWNEKKLFTPQEIAEKDSRGRGKAHSPAAEQSEPIDLDKLRSMLDKI